MTEALQLWKKVARKTDNGITDAQKPLSHGNSVGIEAESLEEKLTSLISRLQAESGILERMVHKNKNQHRRCSYFQYLLKVRRDLRLLQSAKLEELLGSCFQVISGKKPKQKVHLLESLKRRKCESGKYNFMERLLGAARLLSKMVEPMLRAATQISTLLARSFFMGFSLTILTVLARLRVLVQQILLDVVSVFNMISSLSQKKHSVKITQGGLEVYREFYPTKDELVILECEWKSDKFELRERTQVNEPGNQDGPLGGNVSLATSVQYQSIESLLGDDEAGIEQVDAEQTTDTDLLASTSKANDNRKMVEDNASEGDGSGIVDGTSMKKTAEEGGSLMASNSSSFLSVERAETTRVAFVSVKKPKPQLSTVSDVGGIEIKEETKVHNELMEDPFFSLLTGGANVKYSLL